MSDTFNPFLCNSAQKNHSTSLTVLEQIRKYLSEHKDVAVSACNAAGSDVVEHHGTQNMIQVPAKEALKFMFTFKGAVYILRLQQHLNTQRTLEQEFFLQY